jgi:hypothetical protein
MQPENMIWRIEPVRVNFCVNSNGKVILHVGFRSVNAHGRTGKSNDLLELPFHNAI